MKRDIILPASCFQSSFLSCEKDCETILRKLFVTSKPYSNELKRLLVINTKDCLDNTTSKVYKEKIDIETIINGIQVLSYFLYDKSKAYLGGYDQIWLFNTVSLTTELNICYNCKNISFTIISFGNSYNVVSSIRRCWSISNSYIKCI